MSNPDLPSSCCLPVEANSQRPPAQATCLNQQISVTEVADYLIKLHNGRTPGPQGLPSELLRYAVLPATSDNPAPPHQLVQPLTHLLDSMFETGHVPAVLCNALITPVYKKGGKLDTTNYRPIAVMDPLLKVYSSILNSRLFEFMERNNYMASSQADLYPIFPLCIPS